MQPILRLFFASLSLILIPTIATAQFRVLPYLQNPAPDAMTILWFSTSDSPGQLAVLGPEDQQERLYTSAPVLATALSYPPWEANTFFSDQAPSPPYRHSIRLANLKPNTSYTYSIEQDQNRFDA